ncbi:MAG TPA: Spy/CpxP family protein refolding chaperone [Rhizomicrobium sp.]|nr:Spy/CpxP family protein refolding chaperone [Rhizomicrobium sp.]
MKRLLLLTALGLVLTSGPALAVTGDGSYWPMMSTAGGSCPMAGGPGMMRGSAMMSGDGMMSGGMMSGTNATALDSRLGYLKTQLEITNAQLEAWNGYADALKDRLGVMQLARRHMFDAMRDGGTLARMDARITAMEAMLNAMKALRPATAKLYAVLTPDQKANADRLIGAGCGMM